MKDNLLRGGGFMLAATLLFSTSDTLAKYITQSVPAVELATIRYAVFVAMAASPLLRHRRTSMRSRRPTLQIVRGVGVVGSAVFFVLSLGTLPIAEATALNFITPLLVTVLAVPVLGERVQPLGWVAVMVGFAGMLVVVRPGLGSFHPASLLILLSSLLWSVATLVTRQLAGVDRTGVTLLWTACTGLVMLLCVVPFFLAPLTPALAGLCLLVGVVASAAQWCAVLAYRYARASVLAPLSYSQLVWASLFGFFIFGTVPDHWTMLGATIIAVSGLAVVHLERVRVAKLRAEAV